MQKSAKLLKCNTKYAKAENVSHRQCAKSRESAQKVPKGAKVDKSVQNFAKVREKAKKCANVSQSFCQKPRKCAKGVKVDKSVQKCVKVRKYMTKFAKS